MRLVGLLSLMAAALGAGVCYLRALGRELRYMQGLCLGMRALRAELALRLSPMRELLLLASERSNRETARFFLAAADAVCKLDERGFPELWTEACRRTLGALSADNRRDLEQLGLSLGRFGLEDQLAACDRWLSRAEEWIDRQREAYPERRRLALGLGAAAGAFLCLLML